MTLNGVMSLFSVISANSCSLQAHCVKVHVRYLISWWVLVKYEATFRNCARSCWCSSVYVFCSILFSCYSSAISIVVLTFSSTRMILIFYGPHWHRQLWGTVARVPSTYNNNLWPPYVIGQAIYMFILSFVVLSSSFFLAYSEPSQTGCLP